MLAGVCVVLVRHWRRSGPVQRRALTPVAWTGGSIAVVGLLGVIPSVMGSEAGLEVMNFVLVGLITALPFAFLAGLMRSTLSRAGAISAHGAARRRRERARRAGRSARRSAT